MVFLTKESEMKHTIDIDGLPEGFEVKEVLLIECESNDNDQRIYGAQVIVKKKQPRRIVLEECPHGFIYYEGRYWREVKESELSLHREDDKESFVPKVGEYFRIEHKGVDRSWRKDVFICSYSDGAQVICNMKSKLKTIFNDPITFINKEWNFFPVTDEALIAAGVKKEAPKLCLSVEECKELVKFMDSGSIKKFVASKIRNFLKQNNDNRNIPK